MRQGNTVECKTTLLECGLQRGGRFLQSLEGGISTQERGQDTSSLSIGKRVVSSDIKSLNYEGGASNRLPNR